jgi:hypothetical protein
MDTSTLDLQDKAKKTSDIEFSGRWMVIGPFSSKLSADEFPVDFTDPLGVYENGLKWRHEVRSRLEFESEDNEQWYFIANYLYSREKQQAAIAAVTDMDIQWYLNGETVYCDQNSELLNCDIELRHGWNLLLCRCLVEAEQKCLFSAGFLDGDMKAFDTKFIKNAFMLEGNFDSHIFGKNPGEASGIEIGDIESDWKRSEPDYVVYIPREGRLYNDGDNEHFLVVQSPNSGDLLAFWTQGLVEPSVDNHFVLSRSGDGGRSWSEPQKIAGTSMGGSEDQASWGFPLVSRSGRIYAFYTKSAAGTHSGVPGVMGTMMSKDDGRSWQSGQDIYLPEKLNPNYLNDKRVNFIVWQLPIRDGLDRVLAGMTIWSKGRGRCCFIRFDNIDLGPELDEIEISWLPDSSEGMGLPAYLAQRECSEPSVVLLPDGRLFTTSRTITGHPWYSVSDDHGYSWRDMEPLRYTDKGPKIDHPLSCCPIYRLNNGKYILLHNNNKYYADYLYAGQDIPPGMGVFTHRRPCFLSVGEFKPNAHQPIWFDRPRIILDNDGVQISPKASNEIGTYPSLTEIDGEIVLWYPDRKYYLLGKKLNEFIK